MLPFLEGDSANTAGSIAKVLVAATGLLNALVRAFGAVPSFLFLTALSIGIFWLVVYLAKGSARDDGETIKLLKQQIKTLEQSRDSLDLRNLMHQGNSFDEAKRIMHVGRQTANNPTVAGNKLKRKAKRGTRH